MRVLMMAALSLAALPLAGCAGYHGPQTAEIETTADSHDRPGVTNDGFYDGGVFDQDLLDLAPTRLR